MDDLINILSKVRIKKRGKLKLKVGNELLIKLMPSPLFQKSLPVNSDVDNCAHISCVIIDLVWVSDDYHLILIDTATGNKPHSIRDTIDLSGKFHIVNSAYELIHISKKKQKKSTNSLKTEKHQPQ